MRRLPPNKLPAQQHEATGVTHATEPFSISILFDTPDFPSTRATARHPGAFLRGAVWREQDFMRRRKIGFEVIPRSFHGEKDPISSYCSRKH